MSLSQVAAAIRCILSVFLLIACMHWNVVRDLCSMHVVKQQTQSKCALKYCYDTEVANLFPSKHNMAISKHNVAVRSRHSAIAGSIRQHQAH